MKQGAGLLPVPSRTPRLFDSDVESEIAVFLNPIGF